jgi:hypothetical protein
VEHREDQVITNGNDLWRVRLDELKASTLVPSVLDLEGAKQAIRNAPEGFITDAMLRVNNNWLSGARYDAVLTYLLREGFISPRAFGIFLIDRRKLPYEDSGYVLNVPKVEGRPSAPQSAVAPAKPSREPPPLQWGLF